MVILLNFVDCAKSKNDQELEYHDVHGNHSRYNRNVFSNKYYFNSTETFSKEIEIVSNCWNDLINEDEVKENTKNAITYGFHKTMYFKKTTKIIDEIIEKNIEIPTDLFNIKVYLKSITERFPPALSVYENHRSSTETAEKFVKYAIWGLINGRSNLNIETSSKNLINEFLNNTKKILGNLEAYLKYLTEKVTIRLQTNNSLRKNNYSMSLNYFKDKMNIKFMHDRYEKRHGIFDVINFHHFLYLKETKKQENLHFTNSKFTYLIPKFPVNEFVFFQIILLDDLKELKSRFQLNLNDEQLTENLKLCNALHFESLILNHLYNFTKLLFYFYNKNLNISGAKKIKIDYVYLGQIINSLKRLEFFNLEDVKKDDKSSIVKLIINYIKSYYMLCSYSLDDMSYLS